MEITLTVHGALHVIFDLIQHATGMMVGAGSVLDTETARRCLDAGRNF